MIKKLFVNLLLGLFLLNTLTYADKLQDIKDNGVLKVGIIGDKKPFSYKSRTGRLVGFEIDLVKKIAKELRVKVRFVEIKGINKSQYIFNNKVDILLGSMVHNTKLDKNLDFSISYFYDGQSILAPKGIVAGSYKDFSGKKIAAVSGSTSGAVFEVIQPFTKIIYFSSLEKAIKATKDRKVHGVTDSFGRLNPYLKESNGELRVVGKKFTLEPYGIAMKENESNLRDEVNFAIQNIVKAGEYTKLYKKWFKLSPDRKPILWP